AYDYRGTAGALVRRAKLDRDPAALGLLGDAICRGLPRRCPRYRRAVVVPVPLARAKRRRRGFNQAEVLAERLARRLDVPSVRALRRVRDTATQGSQTSIAARQANVAGAFALRWSAGRRASPHVVLVDDVATSGATLCECARVLRRAGCGRIDAIVFARA
ncbi:MAG: ComF family protein, partial [Planctomycetes bacterium]|nr:ComF family protein [Planctomycetota bacterium]